MAQNGRVIAITCVAEVVLSEQYGPLNIKGEKKQKRNGNGNEILVCPSCKRDCDGECMRNSNKGYLCNDLN